MKKTFLSLFLLLNTTIFAQVAITFPVNRAVFQRNASNTGFIPIAGTFQTKVERIDARLTPINGGNPVDWTAISVNPNFGVFIGQVFAQAGWYKLEVRASRGGAIVGTSTVDKVGIGEVLIISGQSNAQGYENSGNPPANDDRVNCITNFYSSVQTTEPPFPVISQITENVKIAPFGNGSWCWGKLGDLLADKLNVPILFINSGFEAMGIEAWSKSADGERGENFYTGNFALPGYPYENLRKSLHHYANMFGVRSILWQQGETDNDKKTSIEIYRNSLEYIISRSRRDTGKDISWIISRSSRVKTGTYQPVIDAQNLVIQNYPNTFEGPNTDIITERNDGVHFFRNGLIELARAWNAKLDFNFFSRASSIPPSSPLSFDLSCNFDNSPNSVRITMPNGFKEYHWTNGFSDLSNVSSLEASNGFYRGRAIDYLGNVYYTPLANYSTLSVIKRPNIIAEGPTSFCDGESVKITSNIEEDIFWSTGANSKSIMATQSGFYSVNQLTYLGCFAKSNSIYVDILPKPDVRIVAESETTFCADKNVRLTSNLTDGITWNTGEKSSSLVVSKTGEYSVTARNEFGCQTISNRIPVRVNPLPAKPLITSSGPTTFCEGDDVQLTAPESQGYLWSNGKATRDLTISSSGFFTLKTVDKNGCISPISDKVEVIMKPSPLGISVSQTGTFTLEAFASGFLNLTYEWYKDSILIPVSTAMFKAKSEGTYSVKGTASYQLGAGKILKCISPLSAGYQFKIDPDLQGVSIFPNPAPESLVNIETQEDLKGASVYIYDMRGKLIRSFGSINFETRRTFDLTDMPKGGFLLNIKAANFSVVKRFFTF